MLKSSETGKRLKQKEREKEWKRGRRFEKSCFIQDEVDYFEIKLQRRCESQKPIRLLTELGEKVVF